MKSVGEAPGRFDVLGGVADYSGALVLQTPIAARTRVEITATPEGNDFELEAFGRVVRVDPSRFLGMLDSRIDETALGREIRSLTPESWCWYLLGCLALFVRAKAWRPAGGLTFRVSSEVPLSSGVSSSAALEIATLRALAELASVDFHGLEIAHLGQRAENHIVGAPCGLMDQLASAFGVRGRLLPILCRPDKLQEPLALPEGAGVFGLATGVKHSVGDSPYLRARTAAFMAKKLVETRTGRTHAYTSEIGEIADEVLVPEQMTGADFLAVYGQVDDPLSRIDYQMSYPIRAALRFAVEEHSRSQSLVAMLRQPGKSPQQKAGQLGAAMFSSHMAYGELGLGCEAADQIVDTARKLGPESGVFGTRISGGGSGGTVVVLATPEGQERLTQATGEILSRNAGTVIL